MDEVKAGDGVVAFRRTGEVRCAQPGEWHELAGLNIARYEEISTEAEVQILAPIDPADVIVARGGVEGAVTRVCCILATGIPVGAKDIRAAILGPEDPPEWAVEAAKEVLRGDAYGCDRSPEYIKDQARIIAKHAPKHDG